MFDGDTPMGTALRMEYKESNIQVDIYGGYNFASKGRYNRQIRSFLGEPEHRVVDRYVDNALPDRMYDLCVDSETGRWTDTRGSDSGNPFGSTPAVFRTRICKGNYLGLANKIEDAGVHSSSVASPLVPYIDNRSCLLLGNYRIFSHSTALFNSHTMGHYNTCGHNQVPLWE